MMILVPWSDLFSARASAWPGNCPWPTVLWRACVAALVAGMLARWWGRIWLTGLQTPSNNNAAPAPTPSETKTPLKYEHLAPRTPKRKPNFAATAPGPTAQELWQRYHQQNSRTPT
jgi:hypothetical protein